MTRVKQIEGVTGHSGETITETLVAILISFFALFILTNMILSSKGLIEQGVAVMDTYYGQINQVAEQQGSSGTGIEQATVSLTAGADLIKLDATKDESTISVNYYNNSTAKVPVYSYRVLNTQSSGEDHDDAEGPDESDNQE